MHEVSLCRALAVSVTRASQGRRVEAVHVDVGQLRQIVPEAMAHAWVFVVRKTALDGAELHLNPIPAVLACDDCAAQIPLGPELGFACHACGSPNTHLVSGEEFTLTAIDVSEDLGAVKGEP
ncbi:MAG: hydrogenase maturation nickel metallochaperone HypA [Propionicimonas sp.]